MKKLFAILAVLSLLMVPCVSMASTMTDADLADVTGQMGVTIIVSNLQIAATFSTLTWGDVDGFSDAYYAGFVNVVVPLVNSNATPFVMHIGVSGLTMTIDVGTWSSATNQLYANKSAVAIGVSGVTVTVDAIAAFIFINNQKGVDTDWGAVQGGPYFTAFSAGAYQSAKVLALVSTTSGGTFSDGATSNRSLATDCLGVIGISHISASVNALNLLIMAH